VIPHVLSEAQPYNLEFTDSHLRLFNGRNLVVGADNQVVTTAATNVITTTTAHGWASGDVVQFIFGDAATKLAFKIFGGRQFELVVLSTTTFSLADPITHVLYAFSTISLTGSDLRVARVVDTATSYDDEKWQDIRAIQTGDHAVLLHGEVAPQILDITPFDDPGIAEVVALAAVRFKDGPYLDPIEGSWITPDALTGITNLSLSFQTYVAATAYDEGDFVTASGVHYQSLVDENQGNTPSSSATFWEVVTPGVAVAEEGFVATDIGRLVRLFSEPPLWVSETSYTAGNVVSFADLYWTALISMTGATPSAGDVNPNQPGLKTTTWVLNPSAARWTWGRITALSTSGLIAQDLAGSVNIGNMTAKGGLAACFDGNTSQNIEQAAREDGGGTNSYVGKNYSGASAQAIGSATVYPTSDYGFSFAFSEEAFVDQSLTITLRLRAKATAPSSPSDGTLLGTTGPFSEAGYVSGGPRTITSTDTVTTWNYVWVEIESSISNWLVGCSEVQFYTSIGAAGSGVSVQLLGDPLLYTSAVRTWRLGVYSDTTGWPRCGAWHEGRLWLSGLVQNRIDGSKSNGVIDRSTTSGAVADEVEMAPTDPSGAVADNNAISYTFNFEDKNDIFWMKPGLQGLVCGTQGGEVLVHASNNNNILSPTSIQAHRMTNYGCANIEPVKTGLTTVFVQKLKRRIMEYLADAYSGKYYGPNLTEFAKHVTRYGVEEIAYQEELAPVVWLRDGNGGLSGCTYRRVRMRSEDQPDFRAWHQHTLGSDREVESIAVGPSIDGNLDTLAIVSNDLGTSIRHVELAGTMFEEDDLLTAAAFLDDAIVPITGETVTVSSIVYIRFWGLWNLNGKKVTVFAAGLDCGDYLVEGGYCDVPLASATTVANATDDRHLFTFAHLSATTNDLVDFGDLECPIDSGALTIPCIVGFTYTSRGQLLRPVDPKDVGTQAGPGFGKTRRVHHYAALLQNCIRKGIKFGTSFTNLKPALFKTAGGTVYEKTELFSGMWTEPLSGDNDMDGQICWEVTRPYPAIVCAVGGFQVTQDK
jgi:hypothetical protein